MEIKVSDVVYIKKQDRYAICIAINHERAKPWSFQNYNGIWHFDVDYDWLVENEVELSTAPTGI